MAQQDSTSSSLQISELKQITELLVELKMKRDLYAEAVDKESVYQSIIKGYQNDQELSERQIENLKLNIEAVTPAWYNNFWTGAAVMGIVISSIYFMAN